MVFQRGWVVFACMSTEVLAQEAPTAPVADADGTVPLPGQVENASPEDARSTNAQPTAVPAAAPPPDPDTIAASELPAAEPAPPPAYPRSFVQRPLLLPPGLGEKSAAVGFGRQGLRDTEPLTFGVVQVRGRRSSSAVELGLGALFAPLHRDASEVDYEVPVVQRVYGSARLRITDDTGLGGQLLVRNVDSDIRGYTSSLFLQHKLRPSDRGAIVIGGSVDYDHQNLKILRDHSTRTKRINGSAAGGAEVQLTTAVALHGFGSFGVYRRLENAPHGPRTGSSYTYGGGLLISVTDNVDLVPYIESFESGDLSGTVGVLMVNAR